MEKTATQTKQRRVQFRLILKRIKAMDYVMLLVYLVVLVGLTWASQRGASGRAQAVIASGGQQYRYDLSLDSRFEIPGSVGPSIIEIRDGQISFFDSPCKDKLCVHMGWLQNNGQWAACLPNAVFINIEGNQSEDFDVELH